MLNFAVLIYALLVVYVFSAIRQNALAGRDNPAIVQHFGWGLMVVSLLASAAGAAWALRLAFSAGDLGLAF